MQHQVKRHAGIYFLSYNSTSQSILAQFDTDEISNSELVLRIAVAISVARNMRPVSIGTQPRRESIDKYGLVSGAALVSAAVARIVAASSPFTRLLTTAAGAGTAAAILSHAWRQYRNHGDFHPETLSVIYLGSSFARGTVLQAATVAWLATFARHFSGTTPERYVLEVEPGGAEGKYGARVRKWRDSASTDSLLQFAASVLADAVSGSAHHPDSFLSQMQEVSRSHDSILEGLEGTERTIRLSIE